MSSGRWSNEVYYLSSRHQSSRVKLRNSKFLNAFSPVHLRVPPMTTILGLLTLPLKSSTA